MFKKLLVISALAVLPLSMVAANSNYQRCAACHLAEGQGVPGAFPPLKNRVAAIAASKEGREYLVKVVNSGLMGPISIAGQNYMGVMPAQGSAYTPEQMTELLNYLVKELDKDNTPKDWQAYTLAEVKRLMSQGGNAMSNAQLRKALLQKYPQLQ